MRTILLALAVLLSVPAPGYPQAPSLEDELRAEITRLRESLARAEAVLARVEKERPAEAPTPPAAPPPSPAAQVAEAKPAPPPPARRAPALNTPPKLPVSDPENYKKTPPRIDVLLMGRYDYFADSDLAVDNTFFLRKAEVGFKANITRNVDFSLELDPIRVQLNDPYRRTYIRLSYFKHAYFKIGMEKAPMGLEELQATAQIPFVDRSEVTGRFAAAEEMGVFLESNWSRFMFQASLTNGGRRLYVDNNSNKAFTARAVWAPTPTFSLGASTMQAKVTAENLDRQRYNVETKYGADNQSGAQGEFYRAKEGPVWSTAFYVEGYWAFPLRAKILTHIQPVARYEFIGRSDENPALELRLVTVGVGLLFKEYKSKLQVNFLKDVRSDSPRPDELRAQYVIEF
jgi:Phosphate-selective porin O and P